jgi:hypothetical protein
MTSMVRETWVYIRGDESIWITRDADCLYISGPLDAAQTRVFDTEASLTEFVHAFGAHLTTKEGWVLQAFVDRRVAQGPMPFGERRRGQHGVSDS